MFERAVSAHAEAEAHEEVPLTLTTGQWTRRATSTQNRARPAISGSPR